MPSAFPVFLEKHIFYCRITENKKQRACHYLSRDSQTLSEKAVTVNRHLETFVIKSAFTISEKFCLFS